MSTQLSLIFFNRTTKTSGGGFFLSFYFANWWFNFSMEYTSEKWAKEKVCWSEHLGSSSPRPQISQTSYSYTRWCCPRHLSSVWGKDIGPLLPLLPLSFTAQGTQGEKLLKNDPLTELLRVKNDFLSQLQMPSCLLKVILILYTFQSFLPTVQTNTECE